ncbi:hypothetical protein [Nocardioides antri]|uniref:Uncharacterized protein n=1 Tax=Nocardioides antri TaxID=2607659 RepID=A0A5B1LWY7_9ACTN|nr:hypothetical protein [Nocardioides antri]KAA1424107.1 hypothetical protein F0U47_19640 [Nocardioides antri]
MVEELLNRRLVAVERLSWQTASDSLRREVGPVRLVFDTGHALVLSGGTDWTLDYHVTGPGDDSWLDTYKYDLDGQHWALRDAAAEEPFADVMGAALTDWQSTFNEVSEVVGLRLWFDGHEVALTLRNGEVAT